MKTVIVALTIFIIAIIAAFASPGPTTISVQENHGKKHAISPKQYDDFHEVLHPLQHEALPKKDFARIRAKSALLVKRGHAIVRLGIPHGVSESNQEEFATELSKFRAAIAKFRTDAKVAADSQLEVSYSAVHDSFEMLLSLLPRD